jgi:hypothetical protein
MGHDRRGHGGPVSDGDGRLRPAKPNRTWCGTRGHEHSRQRPPEAARGRHQPWRAGQRSHPPGIAVPVAVNRLPARGAWVDGGVRQPPQCRLGADPDQARLLGRRPRQLRPGAALATAATSPRPAAAAGESTHTRPPPRVRGNCMATWPKVTPPIVVEQGWRAGCDLGHREPHDRRSVPRDRRRHSPRWPRGHKSLASDSERETWRCVAPGGAEGIEPLTPCMPLTSRWLTPQRLPIRSLLLALVSRGMAAQRHWAV